jgi:hypothetical protein
MYRADAEIVRPVVHGLGEGAAVRSVRADCCEHNVCARAVEDWDAMEQIWDETFKNQLAVDPRDHPVMVADPSHSPHKQCVPRALSLPPCRDGR